MTEQLAHREPTEAQAKVAREVEARIVGIAHEIRRLWIRVAEDLHGFCEAEMWRDLGHPSLEAWIASPEVDISRRQVFYLREAWREFVINRGVQPAELEKVRVSKMQAVLPAVRRGFVDPEDALSDCEVLGRDDLREKYDGVGARSQAGPKAVVDQPLAAETEPEYAICVTCGSRYRKKMAA